MFSLSDKVIITKYKNIYISMKLVTYLMLSWKPPNTISCFLHCTILCPLRADGPPGALENRVNNYIEIPLNRTPSIPESPPYQAL